MAKQSPMVEHWRARGANAAVASELNVAGRLINNIRVGANDAMITRRGIEIPEATAAVFPWSKLCFGFVVSGETVTIKAGEIQWGTTAHSIADTTVTMTADYQYVGVYATKSAAGIILPSTDVALFRPDADTWRRWLYQFRRIQTKSGRGLVSLHRIGFGNLDIGTVGA